MGVINANISINPSPIVSCNDLFKITLGLTSVPDINSNPVDIFLVLDRSGSMAGEPIINLKQASKQFVDIINQSTNNGVSQPTLGTPNRIGVVSFADTAQLNQPLTDNVANLNASIDSLSAGGLTNHKQAFEVATASYIPPSNKKIMVLMTDGETTVGGNADQAAQNAKDDDIEIYCIGLGGVNVSKLNTWASDPVGTHVIIAPTPEDLEDAFKDLAENIILPGATDISVEYNILDEFDILSVPTPVLDNPLTTTASATISNENKTLTWNLDVLGLKTSESATVSFYAKYSTCGDLTSKVTESIVYTDSNNSNVKFVQSPTEILFLCNPTIKIDFNSYNYNKYPCEKIVNIRLPDGTAFFEIKCSDEPVKICVNINNYCPNRDVKLGIAITELIGNKEYTRIFAKREVATEFAKKNDNGKYSLCVPFLLNCDYCHSNLKAIDRTFKVRLFALYDECEISTCEGCPQTMCVYELFDGCC